MCQKYLNINEELINALCFLKVWALPGGLRAKMVRTSRAESWVRNSPLDPGNPPDQVSGGAVQNLPSSRAGGQDNDSLHKLPQIKSIGHGS